MGSNTGEPAASQTRGVLISGGPPDMEVERHVLRAQYTLRRASVECCFTKLTAPPSLISPEEATQEAHGDTEPP